MFASRNASLLPSLAAAQPCVDVPWTNTSIRERYVDACASFERNHANRPVAPRELTALVSSGHFEEALRGLSFIIRPSDVVRRAYEMPGGETLTYNQAIDGVLQGTLAIPLSDAERAVVSMMRALRTIGLDSATHPGDRAIDLVTPFVSRLNQDLDSRYSNGNDSLSYRVLGAASLIAAQASRLPAAQPCGVQILRAAQERGIPRVMITSHHSLGGDAVPLIAEHCAREGLLSGEVTCQRLGYTSKSPDIFWVFKESPEAWLECFERLAQLHIPAGTYILVVEDTLGPLSDDPLALPVEQIIVNAHKQCAAFQFNPLTIAADEEEALRLLETLPIGGVMTDLFIPTAHESLDKSCGEATVREVLLPYLEHSEIDALLTAAQRVEREVAAIMEREAAALIGLP